MSAGIIGALVMISLSGCVISSTKGQAVVKISSRVAEIKDEFSKEVQQTSLESELSFGNLSVQDLRSLTGEEIRQQGWPLSGFYALESDPATFSLEIVVVSVVNEAGFPTPIGLTTPVCNWTACQDAQKSM